MRIGMIGLGRMGMNMARRILKGGHETVVYNRTPDKVKALEKEGATGTFSLTEMVVKLSPPRVVWLMLPAGEIVDDHILKLKGLLSVGDIIVEGGNTNYRDDVRRDAALREYGIHYMDAGVSGGIWGLERGYCIMAGGEKEIFSHVEPVFKTLAPENGYLHCGPVGSGHFVKMVHNGIEYAMMQAYGEGFQILKESRYAESLDFALISNLWNQGSVIRSWLLELAEAAFSQDGNLSDIKGYVEDSGEGRWTVEQAIETGVSAPVITLSLMQRFRSRQEDAFSDKVIAALRREFGGHGVKSADQVEKFSK